MKNTTQLNDAELQTLSDVLQKLEYSTLKSTGYNRVSGGYAVANHFDYDDDIIDVELRFGSQSDTDDYSTTEQYKVCRKTFQIIN
jgi:hypothetical protein